VLVEAWRVEYNTYRPHSSLGGLTLADYAEQLTTNQPAFSLGLDHSTGPRQRDVAVQGRSVRLLRLRRHWSYLRTRSNQPRTNESSAAISSTVGAT
jgi:hypothetical protein